MLCTALNELNGGHVAPYRSTHKNHPSNKWVRESSANFMSLVVHCSEMIEEYKRRFNKIHKCEAVLNKVKSMFDPQLFPSHDATKLPLAMPSEYKSDDIVESYRRFYASKPRVRYPKNKVPKWFIKYRGNKEYQII